ncbi:hypothetical protein C0Q70_00106 [Pomacea canaliculata]|uniref:Uncharacterized protein n=1 Tax=Pomacea canaliculata TaxID=400727 RepID=A0A2T7PVR3_POMCA|nr:hypothetical protein C0Q70_00106 [Pomacea canaliculata]
MGSAPVIAHKIYVTALSSLAPPLCAAVGPASEPAGRSPGEPLQSDRLETCRHFAGGVAHPAAWGAHGYRLQHSTGIPPWPSSAGAADCSLTKKAGGEATFSAEPGEECEP